MKRGAGLTAVVAAAALVAGCGQVAAPHGHAGAKASDAASTAGSPWLLRLDSYSGEDGETKQATYLTITPQTGEVVKVTTPRLKVAEASGPERVLLVDADRSWALLDSRPSRADRAAGRVTLYDLRHQGGTQTVDVRRATGDAHLTPDWVAFDVRQPHLLRVVDGLTVWTVPVEGAGAKKEGVLQRRPGWIFNGGFDKNTGLPYIEQVDGFGTIPPGNGEMSRHPVLRDGGRVLPSDNGRFAGLPDAGCGLGTAFRLAAGDTWAFCVRGTHLQARMIGPDGKHWSDVGKPTPDVVGPDAEPAFVLPSA